MRVVSLGCVVVAIASVSVLAVQTPPQPATGPEDLCAERYDSRRQHHCEVREDAIPDAAALDIDPGRNGSVRIRGSERSGARLRTRVDAHAESEARARELVDAVRVTTTSGRIRSDGMMTLRNEQWATSFYLDVPRTITLAINTHNGGISLEDFSGAATMRAVNGAITLTRVGGDLHGQTQNGGLRIDLGGSRWEGKGLDVETHNGSVRLTLPAAYSAELETGTVHGHVAIDFPMLIHAGQQRLFTTTLGSGGAKIRAMTTNGSVTVRRE
jgi:DUF4097 and DUF4098 domain-containing protein YvlB